MKILIAMAPVALRAGRCWVGSLLALAGLSAGAQEARLLDGAYLDSLRGEIRTNHPSFAAAQARVQAAEADLRGVRLWEDPMAGIGIMRAEREMRAEDGDFLVMAEQVLPRRKLYQARKARARAERSISEAETRAVILTLETIVAQTALKLALEDETFTIETNQLGWLERMASNARDKLKDPTGNASEALRIESEVAQARQKIDSTARNRTRLTRQLNLLLNRPVDAAWPMLRLPDSGSLIPALADEMNRLLQVNPMLHILLNTAKLAQADIEVAGRERGPIFSVGIESRVYSGGDFRQATVLGKMTLPLFNRSVYRANIERATQLRVAAEKEVEALQQKLRVEAVAAYIEADNAAHQADTFSKEVVPRAEQAAESTQNAWISSKASLLEVLESRRSLLNLRLEQRRFVASHQTALELLRSIVPPPNQP